MIIDYTFYLVALIPSLIYLLGLYAKNNNFEKIAFLLLLLITALRYNVGGDYSNYYIIFNNIQNGELLYLNEPLFLLLNKLIIWLDLPFNSILLIADGFLFYTLYKIFNTVEKKYRFFLFFLFMFSFDAYWSNLIYLRQEIAMTFFLLSIQYIKKESFIKFFILIFIGSLFHNILFLFLPLYFIKNITLKRLILMFFLIAVSVYFTTYIIDILDLKQFLYYLRQENNTSITIGYMVKLFIFTLGLYFFKYIKNIYFTLFLIGQFLSIVKIYVPMIGRIELYFIIFHIYGLYMIMKLLHKSTNKYIVPLFMIIALSYNLLSLNKSILQKTDYCFWDRYKIILFEDNDLQNVTNKWIYREGK